MHAGNAAITGLLSAAAVRERAHEMLGLALSGEVEGWSVDLDRLDDAADRTAAVTRERYPDLAIPFHARWRHFVAGEPRLPKSDAAERARAAFDLVILSVLLDAGAGPGWRFADPADGKTFTRSEGLAVASQRLFEGALDDLAGLETGALARGFQVGDDNPLAGLEGRAGLAPPARRAGAGAAGPVRGRRRSAAGRALRRAGGAGRRRQPSRRGDPRVAARGARADLGGPAGRIDGIPARRLLAPPGDPRERLQRRARAAAQIVAMARLFADRAARGGRESRWSR
jgi:hypothetical protein